jgi:hypothetical protein
MTGPIAPSDLGWPAGTPVPRAFRDEAGLDRIGLAVATQKPTF